MRPALKITILMSAFALPGSAMAQEHDLRGYDGYCYAKKHEAQKNGTIIGSVGGGLVGSQISNERGLGLVVGAVIGGVAGNKIGKAQTAKCWKGEYYSYQGRLLRSRARAQGLYGGFLQGTAGAGCLQNGLLRHLSPHLAATLCLWRGLEEVSVAIPL
jgi:hypothetical protein